MSYYKSLLDSDNDMAYRFFAAHQRQFISRNKTIMYVALFGGVAASVVLAACFGTSVASLCSLVGMVWFVFGYHYSQSLWAKEKDANDFYKALGEYQDKHVRGNAR